MGHDIGMRYCGIDVSAKPSNQQLVHAARAPRGRRRAELVATFYAPGDVAAVARTVLGFGGEAVVAVDAPSGRRLDLLGAGRAAARRARPARRAATSATRVCDALLFRRSLPLYPVPAADQALARWERWIDVGFELFAGARRRSACSGPTPRDARRGARSGDGALRFGRLCETYPDAVFCSLLGHRPSPEAHAVGPAAAHRGAASCAASSTTTAGCGTARSTSSTPAPRPTPPTRSPTGPGSWVGDPRAFAPALPLFTRWQSHGHHYCPHGALQQVLAHRMKWQLHVPHRLGLWLEKVPWLLLVFVLVAVMVGWAVNLNALEPFDAWLIRVAGWGTIIVAVVGLVPSLFVPMAYCRYGCPTARCSNSSAMRVTAMHSANAILGPWSWCSPRWRFTLRSEDESAAKGPSREA